MTMLVRLQGALGRTDLLEQMVLLPAQDLTTLAPDQPVNLVVGYDSSPRSQIALDLTLWIAHQTRLATRRQVTVQVVYVVAPAEDLTSPDACLPDLTPAQTLDRYRALQEVNLNTWTGQHPCLDEMPAPTYLTDLQDLDVRDLFDVRDARIKRADQQRAISAQVGVHTIQPPPQRTTALTAIAPTTTSAPALPSEDVHLCQMAEFEQADRILWQARCLADEWRGSLKTHLRFGSIATELAGVVQQEAAALLVLGCDSATNPTVQALRSQVKCPVVGIPSALHPDA